MKKQPMTIEQAIEEALEIFPHRAAADESAGGKYRIVLHVVASEKAPGQRYASIGIDDDDVIGEGDTPDEVLEDFKRKRAV